MTEAEFRDLVERCEHLAARRPGTYRAGVLGLVALGYGYLVFWVLLFLGAGVACLLAGDNQLFKLGVALAALAVVVGRALWVPFERPDGQPLSRSEVPALFAMLDELRARGRVPRIHDVLLNPDFNAAMYQHPRFGMLGGSRNYLILGLPYLLASSPEQLRAVVAHEIGHLAGAHSRFEAWIYRVRRVWGQLEDKLDRGELRMRWLFGPFIRRYFPYFNAYTFALARAQEREADRFAAEATSPRAAAEGLVVSHVLGGLLREEFWPALYARSNDEPEVPDVHPEMLRSFRSISSPQAEEYREAALAETPEVDDTHPSLRERLEALGQADLQMPPAPERTAAEHYLGGQFAALVAAFDQQWRSNWAEKWRAAYSRHQARLRRLAELQARHLAGETMGADEAFEHADLVEDFRDSDESVTLLRALVARAPDHPGAQYSLGRQLLCRDDGSGIGHLDAAMAIDRDVVIAGCELIIDHLETGDDQSALARYRERLEEARTVNEEAVAERKTLRKWDSFVPHRLDPSQVQAVVDQLAGWRQITRAYLVCKRMEHFGDESPVFVLAVRRQRSWLYGLSMAFAGYGLHALLKDPSVKLRDRLAAELELPGDWFALVLNSAPRELRRRIPEVDGALVYVR